MNYFTSPTCSTRPLPTNRLLPKAEGGPTYDTLITNRYRVLWDVTIAGRMLRRGWCAAAVRDQEFNNFHHAFPMLDGACKELFERFFRCSRAAPSRNSPRFAFDPRAAGDHLSIQGSPAPTVPCADFPRTLLPPNRRSSGLKC